MRAYKYFYSFIGSSEPKNKLTFTNNFLQLKNGNYTLF